MNNTVSPSSQSAYQHAAKPEWGVAVIAWEREGKRGYQFEDGQLRVFTSGYFHMLDPIAVSPERVRILHALLGLPLPTVTSALPQPIDRPTIDEQIVYFLRAYPGGFAGEKWQSDRRGGSGRPLKRHRDPAIAFARTELTSARLAASLDQRREQEAVQTLANVLERTDLVAWAHVQKLPALPPNRARALVMGLLELLYGQASTEVRVVQWVQALTRGTGRAPSWTLATAPLALLHPDQHVCVHRTSFLAQAASVAPRLRVPASPSGVDYTRLLAMAESVREALKAASSPGDLLDVGDFISFTLGAQACKEMSAAR